MGIKRKGNACLNLQETQSHNKSKIHSCREREILAGPRRTTRMYTGSREDRKSF